MDEYARQEVCDDVNEAVRLMKVASVILDGAEEYVASAYLLQALYAVDRPSSEGGPDVFDAAAQKFLRHV